MQFFPLWEIVHGSITKLLKERKKNWSIFLITFVNSRRTIAILYFTGDPNLFLTNLKLSLVLSGKASNHTKRKKTKTLLV
jgi:hypothetical protein